MIFKLPQYQKLLRSAVIVIIAVIMLLTLKYLFPGFNWVQTETAILMAIAAWLVNTVRESLKGK